ncbi:SDR family oxidoreductase [Citricoccus sp. I39-566]|uniref:SDR family oxidoreductase n=1 Tax=Citricoccus sp. I39-566 TaxID=3073268 RepID=UPI00286C9719|nr:SDR family oxidoreductase [Citricoccus sp. I39-566]WMY77147.1 SDR family oxidoreductase [Citricoccus sp. I39-566]
MRRAQTPGFRWSGTRVLITGGGSGIGRLMALEAARRGAEVIVWDLSEPAGRGTADAITERGGTARAYGVDVTDWQAVGRTAEETGPVDVVINNAGVVSGARLLDIPAESIERTVNVNILALYWVTRAFLGGMIARGHGSVVTIASAAGLTGVARQTDYSASKWAAIGFTESLRNELRADGHPVNTLVVCPFYIDTGMFAGVRSRFPRLLPILDPDEVTLKVIDAIEAGRRQLVLPPLVRAVPVLRALPVAAFDRILDVLGVNQTMDHFTGRPGGAQPPAKGGSTSTRESSPTG